MLSRAAALVALLVTLGGLWTSANAISDHQNKLDRAQADAFVNAFLGRVVEDPEGARAAMTDDSFKHIAKAQSPGWEDWWNSMDAITSVVVNPSEDGQNTFWVEYAVRFKKSARSSGPRDETYRSQYQLVCSSWTSRYVPFRTCGQGSVQLHDILANQ